MFRYVLDMLIRYFNTMMNKRTKDGTFELVLESRDCDIRPKNILKAITTRAVLLSSNYEFDEKV